MSQPDGDFDDNKGGELLLFKNAHNKALRLEVSALRMEFTDHAYIGTDPSGVFYYNNASDLKKSGTHSYSVKGKKNNSGKMFIHVYFKHDGNTYAEFVGADKRNALAQSEMDGYSASGNWEELDRIADHGSTLHKAANNNTVTLNIDTKKLSWTVTDSSLIATSINIKGTGTVKTINKEMTNVHVAGWTGDYIAFFEKDYTSTELLAWFLPEETAPIIPGPKQSYEGVTKTNI